MFRMWEGIRESTTSIDKEVKTLESVFWAESGVICGTFVG